MGRLMRGFLSCIGWAKGRSKLLKSVNNNKIKFGNKNESQ